MTPEGLAKDVKQVRWFHTMDLGHGVMTPGIDASAEKLEYIGMPADLFGKTVLDVGAWDGSSRSRPSGAGRLGSWRPTR